MGLSGFTLFGYVGGGVDGGALSIGDIGGNVEGCAGLIGDVMGL